MQQRSISSIKSRFRMCRNVQKPFHMLEWVLDVQPKEELRTFQH